MGGGLRIYVISNFTQLTSVSYPEPPIVVILYASHEATEGDRGVDGGLLMHLADEPKCNTSYKVYSPYHVLAAGQLRGLQPHEALADLEDEERGEAGVERHAHRAEDFHPSDYEIAI